MKMKTAGTDKTKMMFINVEYVDGTVWVKK